MNDYKELIDGRWVLFAGVRGDAAFRHIISECGADGKVWFDKRFICDYVSHLKYAIEQLANDRNASVDALKALVENVDAVPVVRCKDCKYSNTDHAISVKRTWCDYWGIEPDFADFCSYGERKGGE